MRVLLLTIALMLATTPFAPGQAAGTVPGERPRGTIAFSSLAPQGWDLYLMDIASHQERRLTDHPALDYDATFAPDGRRIAFVSERDGNLELYTIAPDGTAPRRLTAAFALDDHPAWSPDGRRIAFVSTRAPAEVPGRAWNAIYIMDADGSGMRRLSGPGVADYSPTWSPRGDLIALASGSGVAGGTDLFVMKPDGSDRRLVVKDGGWPTFAADGQSVYFHRRSGKRWGIWRVSVEGSEAERITPPEIDASTPQASADGKWLVAAVTRDGYRQIERIALDTRSMVPVTREAADHWNPSLAPDGRSVVYHKVAPEAVAPDVEPWGTPPGTELAMFRLAGAFPAFSPDGRRLALTGGNFSRLDVMSTDGSHRKSIYSAERRTIFSLSWAHEGDRIAFAHGTAFQGPEGNVNIALISPDGSRFEKITHAAGNNGFPAFSPGGKQLVFRSGRAGSKNLYVMNIDGTGIRQLTEGKWTDTMADWSPDGAWIVFASDRDGDFEIWLIQPDGSGLRKLIGGGGRNNHPHFARDGHWVVFTSQRGIFGRGGLAAAPVPALRRLVRDPDRRHGSRAPDPQRFRGGDACVGISPGGSGWASRSIRRPCAGSGSSRRRSDPTRLIETLWPDGRRIYVANDGRVNFHLQRGQEGMVPFYRDGVSTRPVPERQWPPLAAVI